MEPNRRPKRVPGILTYARRIVIGFVVFIAYILVFAAYYSTVLKGHFLFEGITHEASYKLEKEQIVSDLERKLLTQSDRIDWLMSQSRTAFDNENLKHFEVDLVIDKVDSIGISFRGSYTVSAKKVWRPRTSSEIGIGLLNASDVNFDDLLYGPEVYITIDPGACAIKPVAHAFPRLFSCMGSRSQSDYFFKKTNINFGLWVYLEIEELTEVYEFMNSETHLREGLFLRMLYLSAVTATTLGYGDILPITTAARISIAIQSVCGLFLMGWIVFWLTQRREKEDDLVSVRFRQDTDHMQTEPRTERESGDGLRHNRDKAPAIDENSVVESTSCTITNEGDGEKVEAFQD